MRHGCRPHRKPRQHALLFLALLVIPSVGCFNQRAFPMRDADPRPVQLVSDYKTPDRETVAWLEQTHAELRPMLPSRHTPALLTRDLRADASNDDVYRYFGTNPSLLSSPLFNLSGLLNTAQVTQKGAVVDAEPPQWPGFRDVWIPVGPDLHLAGRLGLAQENNRARVSDCIVLIPGLLGDNGLWRTREIARALKRSGLHVLALELRGYGQTEARYPETPYSYGVYEVGDLLAVAEWLQAQPYCRRTGLVGFSWGANQALLVAWEEGRSETGPGAPPRMRRLQRPRPPGQYYQAGVIAFSPVIGFDELVEQLRQNWSLLRNPVLNRMQAGLRKRWQRKGAREASGDLARLVAFELQEAGIDYPGALTDMLHYVRLLPKEKEPHKLEQARIPVLVVQAANDPLGSAQRVRDLFARLYNPMVAGIILPGGGHNGFVAYSRPYFYNLMLRFFQAPATRG